MDTIQPRQGCRCFNNVGKVLFYCHRMLSKWDGERVNAYVVTLTRVGNQPFVIFFKIFGWLYGWLLLPMVKKLMLWSYLVTLGRLALLPSTLPPMAIKKEENELFNRKEDKKETLQRESKCSGEWGAPPFSFFEIEELLLPPFSFLFLVIGAFLPFCSHRRKDWWQSVYPL